MPNYTRNKPQWGRHAARARWGEPRTARLDQLDPAVRRVIVALIDADREAKRLAAEKDAAPPAAETEG